MKPATSSGYRPEIDGLRTLAVVSVILYHLGWSIVPGGFVGVDVFFVISGYLISKLIVVEVENDKFSFYRFYIRRARRILPALFFTVAATFIVGAMVLSPFLLERVGGAAVSTLFSVSNFYFMGEAGYFDVSETVKPLLHTWSLAVEEQFYLMWPLLLVLLFGGNKKFGLIILGIVGLTSLVGAELALRWWPEMTFFMTPFRIYEFAIGAGLVWVERWPVRPSKFLEVSSSLGLVMILVAVFFYTNQTPFPGVNALLPSLGAGLVIFGGKSKINTVLLANRLMSGGGKISYSLYLSHLPLIVLFRYTQNGPTSLLADFGLLVATLVLSLLMYRYIETPFRKVGIDTYKIPNKPFWGVCAFSLFAVSVPSAMAWQQEGWQWRISPQIMKAVGNVRNLRRESWQYARGEGAVGVQPFEEGGIRVLVIGDSHSKSMFNAVYLNKEYFPALQFRRLEFRDQCFYAIERAGNYEPSSGNERRCFEEYARFVESGLLANADVVLVASKWGINFVRYIVHLKQLVQETGARLVVTTRAIDLPDVPELVLRARDFNAAQKRATNSLGEASKTINATLREMALTLEVPVLDMKVLECFGEPIVCPIINDELDILYYDGHHWTLKGAEFFGRRMSETGFLDPMIELVGS